MWIYCRSVLRVNNISDEQYVLYNFPFLAYFVWCENVVLNEKVLRLCESIVNVAKDIVEVCLRKYFV